MHSVISHINYFFKLYLYVCKYAIGFKDKIMYCNAVGSYMKLVTQIEGGLYRFNCFKGTVSGGFCDQPFLLFLPLGHQVLKSGYTVPLCYYVS